MKQNIRKRIMWLAVALLVIGTAATYFYYLLVYRQNNEPEPESFCTNTDPVLYDELEQLRVLESFEEMYDTMWGSVDSTRSRMVTIPGMQSTRTLSSNESTDISICTSMTPQGICTTEQYILVSAYCRTHSHNSVIYVIDKHTHQFIKEIVLEDKDHVGGLAFDTEHHMIWVSTRHNGHAAASAFSLNHLESYDLDEVVMPIPFTYEYELYTIETDSFMTYANGYLYVGHFSIKETSIVQKYEIVEAGRLKTRLGTSLGLDYDIALPEEIKEIPARIQSFAVFANKVILTQSYGWTPSKLLVYNYNSVMNQTTRRYTTNMITMPQKMQQIYIDGEDVYVLFESSAYAYRAQPTPKVDRICILSLADVLKVDIEDIE